MVGGISLENGTYLSLGFVFSEVGYFVLFLCENAGDSALSFLG